MTPKPVKMSAAARDAARELTVSYCAYWEAVAADNHNGIAVWGEILLRAQLTTGIQLLTPSSVQSGIDRAKRLQAAA